jgi:uncharacterized protein (TIGR03435 family)
VVVCAAWAVFGQSAAAPQFDVASVKVSLDGPNSVSGITTGHGKMDARNVTLRRCIIGAYSVGPNQVVGGPDWLDSERFEILAKADTPTNSDALLMSMLQELLATRFQLTLHREKRTIPAFVLEVGKKGPKLEKADGGESSTSTTGSNAGVTIDARNTDMDSFARILARKTDLPVVNQTGLEGVFNFKLKWTPENARVTAGANEEPPLFTAIQEQLGLRLRSQRTPVEVLVIDRAERPSAN